MADVRRRPRGERQSGRYFFHQEEYERHPAVSDPAVQARLHGMCERVSGVTLPSAR